MDLDAKIDRVADLFEDVAEHSTTQGIQPVDLPEPDRSVYFIADIHGVTLNAGLQAWVHYHGQDEDENEVVVGIEVFRTLGLQTQAEALSRLLQIYRENGGNFPEGFDGDTYSNSIWDCEEEIYDALIQHMGGLPETGD